MVVEDPVMAVLGVPSISPLGSLGPQPLPQVDDKEQTIPISPIPALTGHTEPRWWGEGDDLQVHRQEPQSGGQRTRGDGALPAERKGPPQEGQGPSERTRSPPPERTGSLREDRVPPDDRVPQRTRSPQRGQGPPERTAP